MTETNLPQLALSIRNPWAYAIVKLGKDVENRNWTTKYRGPICIHAAKGMKQSEFDAFADFLDQISPMPLRDARNRRISLSITVNEPQFRGGIIATADLIDCVTAHQSLWFVGKFGFVLANVKPVPFIPCRGALSLFDWRKNRL